MAWHNRWQVLPEDECDSSEVLEAAVDTFIETAKDVEVQLNIHVESGGDKKFHLPKKLTKIIQRMKVLARADLAEGPGHTNQELRTKIRSTKRLWRKAKASWLLSIENKDNAHLCSDMLNNNLKHAWDTIKSKTQRLASNTALPVMKTGDGEMVSEPEEVTKIFSDHYRALAQDDPLGIADDEDHWQQVWPGPDQDERENLNIPLTWTEIIEAIRGMNCNTAPGLDMIHSNVLKALVLEESMAKVALQNGPQYR
ncbi:hypothetical protein AX17_004415 [Amanita inopinata Kibby_2008]|nr:hypothetical protein AX17_004415 [Amanita inopinata Kibby_2008]